MNADALTITRVKQLMEKHGVAANKKLGQNFLIDIGTLEKIASAASGNAVLEIGPGMGALTRELAKRFEKVVAVEIDSGMVRVLGETLADCPNVTVLHSDIIKLSAEEIRTLMGGEFAVCANLPYYITTPIIMRLLESGLPITSMVFLIQKEVAQRMCALPGGKDYGALSIAVQYRTKTELVTQVPSGCFYPRPDVSSAVVRLTPKPPEFKPKDEALFFKLARAAFAMRRKTLENNITNAFPIDRKGAACAMEKAGVAAGTRGETLGLKEFAALSDALGEALASSSDK